MLNVIAISTTARFCAGDRNGDVARTKVREFDAHSP